MDTFHLLSGWLKAVASANIRAERDLDGIRDGVDAGHKLGPALVAEEDLLGQDVDARRRLLVRDDGRVRYGFRATRRPLNRDQQHADEPGSPGATRNAILSRAAHHPGVRANKSS